jgi:hypothetical protein
MTRILIWSYYWLVALAIVFGSPVRTVAAFEPVAASGGTVLDVGQPAPLGPPYAFLDGEVEADERDDEDRSSERIGALFDWVGQLDVARTAHGLTGSVPVHPFQIWRAHADQARAPPRA